MPIPIEKRLAAEAVHENYLLQQELVVYDLAELTLKVEDCQTFFNHKQHAIYNVLKSVQNNKGGIFFFQSAGGCGKTYVCNSIAAAVCATNSPALCVASFANCNCSPFIK